MTQQVTRLSGDDWQEWATQLLVCHYGPTEFQRVPDNDKGDAGLEGFTRTEGHAYQAYGCEEPISTTVRYEKQRIKITTDLNKFITNQKVLQRILGNIQITRWALLVPYYDSKEIVIHAATKTAEILLHKLPYVAPTFQVCVCQEEDFPVARDLLVNTGARAIQVPSATPTPEKIAAWTAANQHPSMTLAQKLTRLPTLKTEAARRDFQDKILKWYLRGQEILDALRAYPELYAKIQEVKSHREEFLATALISGEQPQAILLESINELRLTLQQEVRELHRFPSEALAHEAVADWLLRCPLDFPELEACP